MGKQDQAESCDHAKAGQTVSQDVFAIGLKDEGVGAATGADQVETESCIDDSSGEDKNNAGAEALQLEAGEPLMNGFEEDGDGGHNDEGAFKACGKEGDSLVSV